ncbi:unnamed protein product [Arctogadus glacialis]
MKKKRFAGVSALDGRGSRRRNERGVIFTDNALIRGSAAADFYFSAFECNCRFYLLHAVFLKVHKTHIALLGGPFRGAPGGPFLTTGDVIRTVTSCGM